MTDITLLAVEAAFPGLLKSGWQVTSPPTTTYNCIAWAAGDDSKWWWPLTGSYWPAGILRDESLQAFADLFQWLQFEVCAESDFEPHVDRVALYGEGGLVKHAARQMPDGRWTSKLGADIDLTHDLDAIAGAEYGSVCLILRRPSP